MRRLKHDDPGSESGPLGCPACGYDLVGLFPDENTVIKCPECGRRVITLKQIRKHHNQRPERARKAKWWTLLGLLQGTIAAILIDSFRFQQVSNPGSRAYFIAEYGVSYALPLTFLIAGICGVFRGRNSSLYPNRWDGVLNAIALMLCWIPLCLISLLAINLLRFGSI